MNKKISLVVLVLALMATLSIAQTARIPVATATDPNGRQVQYPSGTTTIVPSAARTATTNHSSFDVSAFRGSVVNIDPDVTAASGTSPTLDLVVQQSCDAGASYFEVQDVLGDAFAQATGVTDPAAKNYPVRCTLLRVRAVIGGTTPSFTYVVTLKKAQ